MKRNICLLLLLLSLLLNCCASKPDAQQYASLSDAYAVYQAIECAEVGFLMEASFRSATGEDSGVLYYINGNASYDLRQQRAMQSFMATLLGATYNATEYYADGMKTHVEDGEVFPLETTPEELFGAFPYHTIPLPSLSEVKTLKVEQNGSDSVLYTLTCPTGQKQLVEEIWKLDLYRLAGITVPDYSKEKYGDAVYAVAVSDGELSSLRVTLPVDLYEQVGYTPGYTPNDEDSCLHLTLQVKLTIKETGTGVDIPEWEMSAEGEGRAW